MQKRLIIALSVSLGVSLLVIAFLIGRMTTPASIAVSHESEPLVAAPSPAATEQPSSEEKDATLPARREAPVNEPPPASHVPVMPTAQAIQPTGSSPSPAITSYFAKMDAIQSAGSGDPTIFAQGIVGGLQAGDTSGLDSLVSSAKVALAKATAVQPPPACAEYHRRLLEVLSESVAGTDKMRSALKKGDISDLGGLAAQFQSSQQKVEDLERMKRQLLGQ